ncbi:sugar kinase [Jannaschia pohangensis]|uniref:2-keto-3-deoxygluconate kinase n=1 Tax=Jannaschia pohangensis TaxID=390807 RepID=A0A1I3P0Z8_9RHOB|nr:sugar kinase [Jannaschia pohangensis]SFJ15228.1 2-keto-3-deoxygluconate kinase [Jannaschia pohangensis]
MRTPRLVSIGECMVELSATGTPGTYVRGFAGDTFNTAWYLARLRPDWAVDYLTDVGDDAISDEMLAMFRDAGIGTGTVRRHGDATLGLYMISLTDGERSFAYWRGQAAARRLADDPARLARALDGADLVYVSGITLGILTPEARGRLLDAVRTARQAGAQVAFDPNLRPRLWPDTDTMCAAVMEAAAVADIVLPSHEDEAAFFGDADPAATLARYRGVGAREVVVKNGADMLLFCDGPSSATHTPDPVGEVVDSTAAGDSFNAAYFAERLAGADMDRAVAVACALSARVIGGRGALVALD